MTTPSPSHPQALAEERFADFLDQGGATGALDFEAWLAGEEEALRPALRRLHADWQRFGRLLAAAAPGAPPSGVPAVPEAESGQPRDPNPSAELLRRLGIGPGSSGRYRFRSLVMIGGQGVVLKVWDTELRRPLAMKVVLGKGEEAHTGHTPDLDQRALARFLDEAQITGQLDHPGIVPVHELGADSTGRAWFTMRLVKGQSFKEVIEAVHAGSSEWTRVRALGVLLKVCEAVAYAHSRGIVHRDLKPGNVMVGRYGEVYVMDWGLARVLGQADRKDLRLTTQPGSTGGVSTARGAREDDPDSPLFTMDGDVVGTPAYMPPEQARGEMERVGPRADVYAIGAMLYHLLAGHMPYVAPGTKASNYAVWRWVQEGPPEALERRAPKAPAELVAICEKAMQRAAEQRYASPSELESELRAYLEGRVVRAHRTGVVVEVQKWARRNRALAGTFALIALAGAAYSGWWWTRPGTLVIEPVVAGTTVSIDGELGGTAGPGQPLTVRVSPGDHRVRLQESSRDLHTEGIVRVGRDERVVFDRQPVSDLTPITFRTDPPGASVVLLGSDGELTPLEGRTPFTAGVLPGEYSARFEFSGETRGETALSVQQGIPDEVAHILPQGRLQLVPMHAGIWVKVFAGDRCESDRQVLDAALPSAEAYTLPAGRYALLATADHGRDWMVLEGAQAIRIEENSLLEQQVFLRPLRRSSLGRLDGHWTGVRYSRCLDVNQDGIAEILTTGGGADDPCFSFHAPCFPSLSPPSGFSGWHSDVVDVDGDGLSEWFGLQVDEYSVPLSCSIWGLYGASRLSMGLEFPEYWGLEFLPPEARDSRAIGLMFAYPQHVRSDSPQSPDAGQSELHLLGATAVTWTRRFDSKIDGIWLADLKGDPRPEVFVRTRGSRGELLGLDLEGNPLFQHAVAGEYGTLRALRVVDTNVPGVREIVLALDSGNALRLLRLSASGDLVSDEAIGSGPRGGGVWMLDSDMRDPAVVVAVTVPMTEHFALNLTRPGGESRVLLSAEGRIEFSSPDAWRRGEPMYAVAGRSAPQLFSISDSGGAQLLATMPPGEWEAPLPAQLDEDPELELVLRSYSWNSDVSLRGGAVLVLDADGSRLRELRRPVGFYRTRDLDGDRVEELLVNGQGEEDLWVVDARRGRRATIRSDEELNRWPQAEDLDGDGNPEVLVEENKTLTSWTFNGRVLFEERLPRGYLEVGPIDATEDRSSPSLLLLGNGGRNGPAILERSSGPVQPWPELPIAENLLASLHGTDNPNVARWLERTWPSIAHAEIDFDPEFVDCMEYDEMGTLALVFFVETEEGPTTRHSLFIWREGASAPDEVLQLDAGSEDQVAVAGYNQSQPGGIVRLGGSLGPGLAGLVLRHAHPSTRQAYVFDWRPAGSQTPFTALGESVRTFWASGNYRGTEAPEFLVDIELEGEDVVRCVSADGTLHDGGVPEGWSVADGWSGDPIDMDGDGVLEIPCSIWREDRMDLALMRSGHVPLYAWSERIEAPLDRLEELTSVVFRERRIAVATTYVDDRYFVRLIDSDGEQLSMEEVPGSPSAVLPLRRDGFVDEALLLFGDEGLVLRIDANGTISRFASCEGSLEVWLVVDLQGDGTDELVGLLNPSERERGASYGDEPGEWRLVCWNVAGRRIAYQPCDRFSGIRSFDWDADGVQDVLLSSHEGDARISIRSIDLRDPRVARRLRFEEAIALAERGLEQEADSAFQEAGLTWLLLDDDGLDELRLRLLGSGSAAAMRWSRKLECLRPWATELVARIARDMGEHEPIGDAVELLHLHGNLDESAAAAIEHLLTRWIDRQVEPSARRGVLSLAEACVALDSPKAWDRTFLYARWLAVQGHYGQSLKVHRERLRTLGPDGSVVELPAGLVSEVRPAFREAVEHARECARLYALTESCLAEFRKPTPRAIPLPSVFAARAALAAGVATWDIGRRGAPR